MRIHAVAPAPAHIQRREREGRWGGEGLKRFIFCLKFPQDDSFKSEAFLRFRRSPGKNAALESEQTGRRAEDQTAGARRCLRTAEKKTGRDESLRAPFQVPGMPTVPRPFDQSAAPHAGLIMRSV